MNVFPKTLCNLHSIPINLVKEFFLDLVYQTPSIRWKSCVNLYVFQKGHNFTEIELKLESKVNSRANRVFQFFEVFNRFYSFSYNGVQRFWRIDGQRCDVENIVENIIIGWVLSIILPNVLFEINICLILKSFRKVTEQQVFF